MDGYQSYLEKKNYETQITDGYKHIETLNEFYKELSDGPYIEAETAIDAANKAYDTHNFDDIMYAIEECNKIDRSNPYKNQLFLVLDSMLRVYCDTNYEEQIYVNNLSRSIEQGNDSIERLNAFFDGIEQSPKEEAKEAIELYEIAKSNQNLDDLASAIESAKKLDDSNPYKQNLLDTLYKMFDINTSYKPISNSLNTNSKTTEHNLESENNTVIDDETKEVKAEMESENDVNTVEPSIQIKPTINTNIAREKRPIKYDDRIFTDESRIDRNHSYLSASNATNLGYLNNTTVVNEIVPVKGFYEINNDLYNKIKNSKFLNKVNDFLGSIIETNEKYINQCRNMAEALVDAMEQNLISTDGNEIYENENQNSLFKGLGGYSSIFIISLITLFACTFFVILGTFLVG